MADRPTIYTPDIICVSILMLILKVLARLEGPLNLTNSDPKTQQCDTSVVDDFEQVSSCDNPTTQGRVNLVSYNVTQQIFMTLHYCE